MLENKRRGRFKISIRSINEDSYAVQTVLSEVIVIEAYVSAMDECIHYAGISSHFSPVDLGAIIPEYEVEFTKHTGEVKFTKVR